ncbi:MAG TPA: helix-turn-helix domain-containing protein [Myxococcota bacterium]|nr:helix-turn-helix domain-containing protein [Myxococcota bacterium]
MASSTENGGGRRGGKAATQDAILAAATQLFMERGYEGTTVADVAERAGVSRATVFWHFSDKGGLFREAFVRLFTPFRESLARDFHDLPAPKRLHEQLGAAELFARTHGTELAAFLRWAFESPEHRDGVISALLDLNQRYQGVLIETISEIVGAERDARALGGALWLAVDANFFLSIFDKTDRGFEHRAASARALADLIIDEAQLAKAVRGASD